MRLLLVLALALIALPLPAATWLHDPVKAAALAKKENKLLLIFFTKSNGSADPAEAKQITACHKLKSQLLLQPEFQAYAQDHLILLKLDYSADAVQSASAYQENHQILTYFQPAITTFPTLLITRPDWTELARRDGPQPGDLNGFLLWLQQNAVPTSH